MEKERKIAYGRRKTEKQKVKEITDKLDVVVELSTNEREDVGIDILSGNRMYILYESL